MNLFDIWSLNNVVDEPNSYNALIFHYADHHHTLLSETCLLVIGYQDGRRITETGKERLSYGEGGLYMMCKIKLPATADSCEANTGNFEPFCLCQLMCI